ncbi:hypothetical protein H4S07_000711, partial [Coemansia furcata]
SRAHVFDQARRSPCLLLPSHDAACLVRREGVTRTHPERRFRRRAKAERPPALPLLLCDLHRLVCCLVALVALVTQDPPQPDIGHALAYPRDKELGDIGERGLATAACWCLGSQPTPLCRRWALSGAVIMPHNLFLHSALVGTRRIKRGADVRRASVREANFYMTIESAVALLFSFIINASILIMFAEIYSMDRGNTAIGTTVEEHFPGLIEAAELLRGAFGNIGPFL